MKLKPAKITIVLSALLVFVAWRGLAADEMATPVEFTLQKLGGGKVSLSDFRGNWVLVNYWATWCAPCRKEMPELSRLHESRENVTVLGLAYEDTDDGSFETYVRLARISYPILKVDVLDPPEPFGTPKVLPTSILLDREGRPVKTFLGPITGKDLEAYIGSAEEQSKSGVTAEVSID